MKNLKLIFFTAILLVLLSSCSLTSSTSSPEYSLQGTWKYVFYTQSDGSHNTYDTGTFTFEGDDKSGTFVMVNIYEVEYEGTYSVDGINVALKTAETLEGVFGDATHLSGTWSSEENDVSGTWEAVQQ